MNPSPKTLFMRNQWQDALRKAKEKERQDEYEQVMKRRNTLKAISAAIQASDKAEVRIGENRELQLCLSFPPV